MLDVEFSSVFWFSGFTRETTTAGRVKRGGDAFLRGGGVLSRVNLRSSARQAWGLAHLAGSKDSTYKYTALPRAHSNIQ